MRFQNNEPFVLNFPLLFTALLCTLPFFKVEASEFNRNYTGVTFSPYVRSFGGEHDWSRYTVGDIQTMLKVVSGKFSKVATFSAGWNGDFYQEDVTYHRSYSEVYCGEAAAILNKKGLQPPISMLLGVWLYPSITAEFSLAMESAKKANSLHPGTVWGLVFSNNDDTIAPHGAAELRVMREEMKKHNLKFGTRQNCRMMNMSMGFPLSRKISIEIVTLSDFIICGSTSDDYGKAFKTGATVGFEAVTQDLLWFRDALKNFNPSIEVMGQAGFSTRENTPEEVENLRWYWETMDQWASNNRFFMWMFEAMDNPWKAEDNRPNMGGKRDTFGAHYGWWRLRKDEEVGKVEGYVEKILVLQDKPHHTSSTKVWVYIAISLGILMAIGIFGHLILHSIRVTKSRNSVLSKEEVSIFIQGGIEGHLTTENGPVENAALAKPYDASYEISKDNLTIVWEGILGVGQFGCVYRAYILFPIEGNVEVALKMTKDGCSKNEVKSILSEIKILTHLGIHPHIVGMKGAYTAEIHKGVVYVATEYCRLGSLKGYLRETKRKSSKISNSYEDLESNFINSLEDDISEEKVEPVPKAVEAEISFAEMVRWSYEIACGMEYLGRQHVVHADLATRNVLLTCDKVAKITDFGLSRRLYDYTNYVKKQQEPLPWRWMSIEALRKLEFSSQSDVWSYGVTLWEIFSMGDMPYPGLSWSLNFITSLENGLRMQSPRYASRKISDIIESCWMEQPQSRPTFTKLKAQLHPVFK